MIGEAQAAGIGRPQGAVPSNPPRGALLGASALLFAASAAGTIGWCVSMESAGSMPMPGGWTMSMAWMRMPGQSWPGAAAAFVAAWEVMMVAMMLPSLVPMLLRYRRALGSAGAARAGALTALVGLGYYLVWTLLGLAAFPLGATLSAMEMRWPPLSRAVPLAVGGVVLVAGMFQLSGWKARLLDCCRQSPGRGRVLAADAGTAIRHGLHLGIRCCLCCAGPMAVLLAVGVMDLLAMATVTAAITLERLAPPGLRAARVVGVAGVGAGLFLLARSAGIGVG